MGGDGADQHRSTQPGSFENIEPAQYCRFIGEVRAQLKSGACPPQRVQISIQQMRPSPFGEIGHDFGYAGAVQRLLDTDKAPACASKKSA